MTADYAIPRYRQGSTALDDLKTAIARNVDHGNLQAIADRWTREQSEVEAATPNHVGDQIPRDEATGRGITR